METEHPGTDPESHGLTAVKLRILEYLGEGKTCEEIAGSLNMSIHTVDRHLTDIYEKLGVENGPEAVAKWLRDKILPGMQNIFC